MNIQDWSTKQNGYCLNAQHYHKPWVEIFFLFFFCQENKIIFDCKWCKQSKECIHLYKLWSSCFFMTAPALKADTEQLNVFCMRWNLWTPLPTDSFKLINLSASFVTQGHALDERSLEKEKKKWRAGVKETLIMVNHV